jgi:hypothetical protein
VAAAASDSSTLLYVLIVGCEVAFWPWFITLALLGALIEFLDDELVTAALGRWDRIAFVSVVLWFVFGPVWSLLSFRREAK